MGMDAAVLFEDLRATGADLEWRERVYQAKLGSDRLRFRLFRYGAKHGLEGMSREHCRATLYRGWDFGDGMAEARTVFAP
jgi:hypothetical protein